MIYRQQSKNLKAGFIQKIGDNKCFVVKRRNTQKSGQKLLKLKRLIEIFHTTKLFTCLPTIGIVENFIIGFLTIILSMNDIEI